MPNNHLNRLEREALLRALAGREEWKVALRKQIPHLIVNNRVDTIVGGYTNFGFDNEVHSAEISKSQKGYPAAIDVSHPGLKYGGAFIVWTKCGNISSLEYYANGAEKWPSTDDSLNSLFKFEGRIT